MRGWKESLLNDIIQWRIGSLCQELPTGLYTCKHYHGIRALDILNNSWDAQIQGDLWEEEQERRKCAVVNNTLPIKVTFWTLSQMGYADYFTLLWTCDTAVPTCELQLSVYKEVHLLNPITHYRHSGGTPHTSKQH